MDSNIQAIGMVWYKEADYLQILQLLSDAHLLPRTFLQWQDKAEQGRKRYLRAGHIVVKAYIDPNTFPAWCNSRGLNIDAHARTEFANAEAARILTEANQHS